MCALQGLISGGGIRNIVQLGHYSGYSTLLLGFMMRHMGFRRSVFSVDIDEELSRYTQTWIVKAGLQDFIRIEVCDSSHSTLPEKAHRYFDGPIAMIFIDSSHEYQQTLLELDVWFPALEPRWVDRSS